MPKTTKTKPLGTNQEAIDEIKSWRERARWAKNEETEHTYHWQLLNREICAYNDVLALLEGKT